MVKGLKFILTGVASFLLLNSAVAQKTDLIFLSNGDRLTGEIKELSYGKIRLSTNDMGTVYAEWDKIARIISDKVFEVELQFGTVYYGTIGVSSDRRKMAVIGEIQTFELYRAFVVSIRPIRDTFLQRLDGSISLEFSITKTTGVKQLILGGNAMHESRVWTQSVSFNAQFTSQPQKNESRRADINYQAIRYLSNRWFGAGQTALEQNTEQGIDLRASFGAGGGRKLIQTNHMLLWTMILLSGTRESIRDSSGLKYNLELPVKSMLRVFMFDDPKTDITINLNIFPNMSNLDRIRMEFDSKLEYEFIKDFKARLNFYYTFDNKPPSVTASKDDYTLSTGFVWKF